MKNHAARLSRAMARLLLGLGVGLVAPGRASAWDYEGHRIVTELALAALPTNFPAFALAAPARERIAFLSGEADRWRNTPDLPFKHFNEPDHFLDLDDLPLFGLTPETVSQFRYEFTAQLALGRAARPTNFPPIDPAKNADKTRELVGFLPWTITEFQGKLKSAWSYLRAFERFGGTPDEIANAQANVIYLMGVMSHFVGDAAQPLHATKHYNGWVGPNPHGYTTNRTIHRWIDGGFIQKAGLKAEHLRPRLRPARPLADARWPGLSTNVFPAIMAFMLETADQVEPLYRLEKAGQLTGTEEPGSPGYEFMATALLRAAHLLSDLWLTARQQVHPDTFLERELSKRRSVNSPPAEGR